MYLHHDYQHHHHHYHRSTMNGVESVGRTGFGDSCILQDFCGTDSSDVCMRVCLVEMVNRCWEVPFLHCIGCWAEIGKLRRIDAPLQLEWILCPQCSPVHQFFSADAIRPNGLCKGIHFKSILRKF